MKNKYVEQFGKVGDTFYLSSLPKDTMYRSIGWSNKEWRNISDLGKRTYAILKSFGEYPYESNCIQADEPNYGGNMPWIFKFPDDGFFSPPPPASKRINWRQAQEIIDIACTKWKNLLAEKWGSSIAKKEAILIPIEFYREMRQACTENQNNLFDEIFGKDKKDVDFDKIKTGSIVALDLSHPSVRSIKSEIKRNGHFTVIFYKTPYCLEWRNKFIKTGKNPNYITFNQDGNNLVFLTEGYQDYITEVIEY